MCVRQSTKWNPSMCLPIEWGEKEINREVEIVTTTSFSQVFFFRIVFCSSVRFQFFPFFIFFCIHFYLFSYSHRRVTCWMNKLWKLFVMTSIQFETEKLNQRIRNLNNVVYATKTHKEIGNNIKRVPIFENFPPKTFKLTQPHAHNLPLSHSFHLEFFFFFVFCSSPATVLLLIFSTLIRSFCVAFHKRNSAKWTKRMFWLIGRLIHNA